MSQNVPQGSNNNSDSARAKAFKEARKRAHQFSESRIPTFAVSAMIMSVTVTAVASFLFMRNRGPDTPELASFVSMVMAMGLALGVTLMAMIHFVRMTRPPLFEVQGTRPDRVPGPAREKKESEDKPFETEQVARYYAEVLMQTKVSFWVSIAASCVGFVVIISAAMLYTTERVGMTIASGIAGVIIECVSALFFVQSQRVQASMGEFFEKLRKDRQQNESRRLCDEIGDPQVRDALKLHLSLYYSGIDGSHEVLKTILGLFHSELTTREKMGPNEESPSSIPLVGTGSN